MTRMGEFTSPGIVPCNKCGAPDSKKWGFEISITVDELDDQGFVCDQFLVPKLFDKYATGKWQASCEDFANGALYDVIHELCPRATEVRVKIQPTPVAFAEVFWKTSDGDTKEMVAAKKRPVQVGVIRETEIPASFTKPEAERTVTNYAA